MLARPAETPDAMKIRRRTVEHVFGTLKSWMGSTHFLTKNVATRQHRNEFACAGLQPEVDAEYIRCATLDPGDGGVISVLLNSLGFLGNSGQRKITMETIRVRLPIASLRKY